jgi:hypothetical protein
VFRSGAGFSDELTDAASDSGHLKFLVGGHGIPMGGQFNSLPADTSSHAVTGLKPTKTPSLCSCTRQVLYPGGGLSIDQMGFCRHGLRWVAEAITELPQTV